MRLLISALLMISTAAVACPDLSGNYPTCKSTSGDPDTFKDVIITQSVSNSITTYQFSYLDFETYERDTDTFRADGVMHSQFEVDPHTGMKYDFISTTSCAGDVLNVNLTVMMEGTEVAFDNLSIKKEDGKLIIDSKSFDGQEMPSDRTICE